MNYLYYGDNLDVLRRHIKDESVDLVYLDPPFKSNATYNVLFSEHNGTKSHAQIKAFSDTWTWDDSASLAYAETVELGGRPSQALQAFRAFLGETDMLAYLSMMAPRLSELRRVLKPSGTLYLHCDPTASHYLKMLLDAVFGGANFRNEVIWKRTSAHNDPRRFGTVHDTLLVYAKDNRFTFFNPIYLPYTQEHIDRYFRLRDPDGRRFWTNTLTAPGPRPNLEYPWRGVRPPPGRCWAMTMDKLEELDRQNRIYYTRSGFPLRKYYLDEMKGTPAQDVWTDIPGLGGLSASASERLGYPTQKPQALLERIILASSDEGQVVLDPFCGCGTAVVVAEHTRRKWVGIDITHLAINLIKTRLHDAFGDGVNFETVGEPTTLSGARALAQEDPFQFEWWALGLVKARPVEQKKGPDKGIDGRLYFHDETGGETKQIVFSVKAGKLHAAYVRDLRGVVEREGAQIGVLLTLEAPTKQMRSEASSAGFYESPWGRHPRVQIVTVGGLLDKTERVDMPPVRHTNVTFKRAPRAKGRQAEQIPIEVADAGGGPRGGDKL